MHEWVEGFEDYEAVLVCTNEPKSWDAEQAMRAFATFQFSDATTTGDLPSLRHNETGTIIRHDGGVLAIDCGHDALNDALPDLFLALHALGWRGAEVYHPAATMPALLADMGRAIPANLDFDVRPAGAAVPVADSVEAQGLIEKIHSLRGGAVTAAVTAPISSAQLKRAEETATLMEGFRSLGADIADAAPPQGPFVASIPGHAGIVHLIDDDADNEDINTMAIDMQGKRVGAELTTAGTPLNSRSASFAMEDYAKPEIFDVGDDNASDVGAASLWQQTVDRRPQEEAGAVTSLAGLANAPEFIETPFVQSQESVTHEAVQDQIDYAALAAGIIIEKTANGFVKTPGEPEVEIGSAGESLDAPVFANTLNSENISDDTGRNNELAALNVALAADNARMAESQQVLLAQKDALLSRVDQLNVALEDGQRERVRAEALAEASAAALALSDLRVVELQKEVRNASSIGLAVPSDFALPKMVRVGRSVFCFDLPGEALSVDELESAAHDYGVPAALWTHLQPGAIRQPVRWDVFGEVDTDFPWLAEKLAAVLVPTSNTPLVAAMILALKHEKAYPGLRDVLSFAFESPSERDRLFSFVSPAAVHLQKSVDWPFESVSEDLGSLSLAPVGAAFVDVMSANDELSGEIKELFSVREVMLSKKPRLFVVHVDVLDSPFVIRIAEALRSLTILFAGSGRGLPVSDEEVSAVAEVADVKEEEQAVFTHDEPVSKAPGNAGVEQLSELLSSMLVQLQSLEIKG